MAIVGLDGRWVRVNKAICAIVGYPAEELMRKTIQDITHPEDLQSDLEPVKKLLEGALHFYQIEKRYLNREGRVVWIRLTVSLVRNATGGPVHFVSQLEDISERKRIEQALASSQEQLSNIINTIADPVFVKDREPQAEKA